MPNRIFSSGHLTHFAENNLPSERHKNYYEARAKGGLGMITMEVQSVSRHCWPVTTLCFADTDAIIEPYKMISDAVHPYGTKIFAQLWHNGHNTHSKISNLPVQSCSPVPGPFVNEVPKELEEEEIQEIVEQYAQAALRLKKGGFDGVEIHAGHGYLPQQFLSPFSNLRTDKYGGSLENRMRFSVEIIDAVRRTVGEDFVVGLRTSGDELVECGIHLPEMLEVYQGWEETGQVDFLHVTIGNYKTGGVAIPPMGTPPRPFVWMAAEAKQVVDIPVFTVIKITDPQTAEEIIANNEADMVAMTRATICDPELPNKAKEGREDEIRLCMNCNEGCWGRCEEFNPITCAQNPEAGREGELRILPASSRKQVMIVGGGLAGMTAARVAAEKGHEVVLYEKAEELGGQILVASKAPLRGDLMEAVRNLEKDLARLSVPIELGAEVTEQMVLEKNPDHVVVATGARPITQPTADVVGPDMAVEIHPEAHVVSAWHVLSGEEETGDRVLIYDVQPHVQGFSVADYLSGQGKEVEILAMGMRMGWSAFDADGPTILTHFMSLFMKNVKFTFLTALKSAQPGHCIVFNPANFVEREIPCDTLVLSYWRKADDSLYKALKGKVKGLTRVGDAVAPRYMLQAVYEGYMAANAIE
jgi:2,4-dienoyl-CoA reductase-like NADH-dependent reductase (Old Yellow Enzyme family)